MGYEFNSADWSFIFGFLSVFPIYTFGKLVARAFGPKYRFTWVTVSSLISSFGFLFVMIQFQLLNTKTWSDDECNTNVVIGNYVFPVFWTASLYGQSHQVQLLPATALEKKIFNYLNAGLLFAIFLCECLAVGVNYELLNVPEEFLCFAIPYGPGNDWALALTLIQLLLVCGSFIYRLRKAHMAKGTNAAAFVRDLAFAELANAIVTYIVVIVTMILSYQTTENLNWTLLYTFQNFAVYMIGNGYLYLTTIQERQKHSSEMSHTTNNGAQKSMVQKPTNINQTRVGADTQQ